MGSVISRVHRGFHRIGIVLAVPIVGASLWAGVSEWRRQVNTEAAQVRALTSLSDADLEKIAAGIPVSTSLPATHHANFTAALLLLVVALALYAAARAVGWVLAGFMGSDRP